MIVFLDGALERTLEMSGKQSYQTHSVQTRVARHIDSPNRLNVALPPKCDKPRNNIPAERQPPPRYISDTVNPIYLLHIGKVSQTGT